MEAIAANHIIACQFLRHAILSKFDARLLTIDIANFDLSNFE